MCCVLLLVILSSTVFAQSIDDSATTPTNSTGASLPTAYDGEMDSVNLSNGNLNIRIPLLSLPGRNGLDLNIGIEHDSQMYQFGVSGAYIGSGNVGMQYGMGYNRVDSYPRLPVNDFWRLSIPVLVIHHQMDGISSIGGGFVQINLPYYCDHFVILDADGTRHNSQNIENCSWASTQPVPGKSFHVGYTSNPSFSKLDTTNPNDIVYTRPDGSQVHFSRNANVLSSQAVAFTSIVDRNGNSISLSVPSQQQPGYIFTDTLNRQVTIDSTGITYPDPLTSTGTRTIPWSSTITSASPETMNISSCNITNPAGNNYNSMTGSQIVTTTITLPDGSTWVFTNDQLGATTSLKYPQGGYKRYVHQLQTPYSNVWTGAPVTCTSIDFREIAYKFECADGNCGCINSQATTQCARESKTSYAPTTSGADGGNFKNIVNVWDEQSALLKTEVHNFGEGWTTYPSVSDSLETSRVTTDPSFGTLSTTTTVYPVLNNNRVSVPQTITRTLNDISPNVSSSTVYTYATIQVPDAYTSDLNPAYFSSPKQVSAYGYDGSLSKQTTTTYKFETDSSYGLTSSLMLDFPSSLTWATAPYTSTSYTYTDAAQSSGISTQRGVPPQQHRGNVATKSTGGRSTSFDYYDTGMLADTKDDRYPSASNPSYVYDSSGAFLQSVTRPPVNGVPHVTSYVYDDVRGKVTSITDENNQTTNLRYEDPLWRLTANQLPDGGGSTYSYPTPNEIDISDAVSSSGSRASSLYLDGFGRQIKSIVAGIETDTSYDALGRVKCKSLPYVVGNGNVAQTCFAYDALDRVKTITNPDGSNTTTQYKGQYALTTDASQKKRISENDALGNLVSICEVTTQADVAGNAPAQCPGPFSLTGFLTRYTYDSAGNLTDVSQGNLQTRHFVYDSLSRLTQATNPESGTITYQYTNGGALCSGRASDPCTKTDARQASTTFQYDQLYRLTTKSLSDGTSAQYAFDVSSESGAQFTAGRLTYENSYSGSTLLSERAIFNYDPMGRIQREWQCVRENCAAQSGGHFPLSYLYNFLGEVTFSTNGMLSSPTYQLTSFYDTSTGYLTQVTSSMSEDNLHPSVLFNASAANYGPFGLLNANLGMLSGQLLSPRAALQRTYDPSSGRLKSETFSGNTSATPGFGTITVTGIEQSKQVAANYGTGTVTLSGAEQVVSGSASSGTISVSGVEQSKTQTATAGTATVTIAGFERSMTSCLSPLSMQAALITCPTIYDAGTVAIVVNGYTKQVTYSKGSTSTSIATALASAIQSDTSDPVTATSSGSTITLTARTTGATTNYSLSTAVTYDDGDFVSASFTATPSGATLTGGKNGGTIYDSGIVTATVNGNSATANWGQSSTPNSIAAALASAINSADSSFLSATSTGSVVNVTSAQQSSSTNWPITISVTYDTADFSSSSFSVTGAGMSGGKAPVYDSGTVSVTVNGVAKSVSYGQGDSPSSIATKLAGVFSSCSSGPAVGTSSGAVLTLTSCQAGSTGNYTLGSGQTYDTAHFSSASFSTSNSGASLTGGTSTGTTVYDQGSVQLTIGPSSASVPFNQSSTAASIASSLASQLTGSTITVTANGSALNVSATGTGSATNYPITNSVTYDSSDFGSASFGLSPTTGALTGGMDASSGALYAYNLTYYPNGNLQTLSDTVIGNWSYGYDDLNRLSTANASSGVVNTLGITFPYDRYGNRWTVQYSGNPQQPLFSPTSTTFTGNNNRVDQIASANGYDASGNVVYDPTSAQLYSYTYNANNQIAIATAHSGTAYSYIYDAEGRRVAKLAGNSLTSSPISNVYILGTGGEQLSELDGGLNWKHSNVYVAGKLLATYDQNGTHFQFADWLGSRRFQIRADGAAGLQCTSLPFGDNLNCLKPSEFAISDSDSTEHHFTGKEHDNETGLDDFGARYYGSNMGRFMSPDIGVDQHPEDPESWNLYTYARNNPLALVDPTGEYICGSSMTQGQCDEFQKGLDKAQEAANAAKNKYGANSDQYKDAQRAIDAYGNAGVDNGVTIQVGDTGKYAALTTVGGSTGPKTADNPTGQKIEVTFKASALGNAMDEGHEGSHVADGSAWVASGFSTKMNPTKWDTEMRAYRVSATIGEGLGYILSNETFGQNRYVLAVRNWDPKNTDIAIGVILRKEYKLVPTSTIQAFQKNTKGGN